MVMAQFCGAMAILLFFIAIGLQILYRIDRAQGRNNMFERDVPISGVLCLCERDFTSHCRVEYGEHGVTLVYGKLDPVYGFSPVYYERVEFSEAPELRDLMCGGRWQWAELWALVESAEKTDAGTPMRIFLQDDASGAWRETWMAIEA